MKNLIKAILFLVFAVIFLYILIHLHSCNDNCEDENLKCEGTYLLKCVDGDWKEIVNCIDYIPEQWTCCAINGESTCRYIEECENEI